MNWQTAGDMGSAVAATITVLGAIGWTARSIRIATVKAIRSAVEAHLKEISGNGFQTTGRCLQTHASLNERIAVLEHEVGSPDGYVRSRIHEIANALHVKLMKRELRKMQRAEG